MHVLKFRNFFIFKIAWIHLLVKAWFLTFLRFNISGERSRSMKSCAWNWCRWIYSQKTLFLFPKIVNKLIVHIIFHSKMSRVAIKKVRKFQKFFVQILKVSMQILKFKTKLRISPFRHTITSSKKLKMKISSIFNNSRPLVGLNNNLMKSSKQMKFSCEKVCKFQNHLP